MPRRKRKPVVEERGMSLPGVSLSSPQASVYLSGQRSSAGVPTDRHSVLSIPAVWRCIDLIAGKISRLDLHVYKHSKDGGREIDQEHPAEWILAHKPNELMTVRTWRYLVLTHCLLSGNSYSLIVRDDYGNPTELIPMDPDNTGVAIDSGKVYITSWLGNQWRKFLPENVLHFKWMSWDGIVGLPVTMSLSDAFGLSIATQRYTSVFFRNNGNPGPLILKFPTVINKEKLKELRDDWENIHQGVNNAHKFAVLGGNGSIEKFDYNNETMQLLGLREHEIACSVASIFGIPPWKLGIKGSKAYNSLIAEEASFLNDCISSWLVNLQEEMECKLMKESQHIRDSHSISFDTSDLELADPDARSKMIINLVNNGMITDNMGCKMLKLPGKGPDGEMYRLPTTVQYVDEDGIPIAAPPPAPAAPPEPDQGDGKQGEDKQDGADPGEKDDQNRSLPLLTSVLDRWVRRVAKDANRAASGEDWQAWTNEGLEGHRSVLEASLAPVAVDARAEADQIIGELRSELQAVSRAQVGTALGRIDSEALARRILG